MTSNTDARGVQTDYVCDVLNRVMNRNYSTPNGVPANYQAAPNVVYTYDNLPNAKGKLIKVENLYSKTEYTQFDILGRVTKSKQTTDGTAYNEMEYVYNLSGAMVEQKYPSGRVVKNVLDNDGDLSMVQSKKNANAGYFSYADSFTYTAAGAVSSMQLGNGKWESTQFNSRLQPTQIALGTVQSGTDKLKLDFTYNTLGLNYNNGNVLSQTITVPTEVRNNVTYNGFTANQAYVYDPLNRIKQATETVSGQSGNNWQQTFVYDRFGNRAFDELNTTTLPKNCVNGNQQAIVCANMVAQVNPSANTGNNRLNGYTFDTSGNTILDAQSRKFTYDGENKQVKVETVNGGGTVTATHGIYFYDGDGKRVKKIGYENNQIKEITIFVYDAGGKMVAEYSTLPNPTPQVSYLTSDHLGSPRINTDENGKVIARHDFQPFGEEIQRASYGADDVRQKFTGYERDNESGLDYAKARMFGSSLGRFTSPDDFLNDTRVSDPQSWNLYVYVRNNPLRYIDPDGEIKKDCGKNKDEICFDVKDRNVDRSYGSAKIPTVDADGNSRVVTVSFTGKVNTGTIYADDGTAINAEQSTGPLTATATDENGNVLYQGGVDGITRNGERIFSGMNNVADCHGVSFADGQYWINDSEVEKLMIGDGYDVNNPSQTPTQGAVGIFSTDGNLANTRHSVTVVNPGNAGVDPMPANGEEWLTQATPTLVDSKGGITPRVVTTPSNSWTNTQPDRQNHKLFYYTKKVKN